MFGQSFFIKKILQKAIEEICVACEMDEDDAKDLAKGLSVIGGIGAAIVTMDFPGGAGNIIEEVGEGIIEEEIFEETASTAGLNAAIQFGAYGDTVIDGFSSTSSDVVYDRVIDQFGNDRFGNHVSEIMDQSVSYGMLDLGEKA